MATIEQKTAWLAAAEAAYNNLMIGGAVRVTVDQNGERVEFTSANAERLEKYIRQLQRDLGLIPYARPAGVYF